MEATKQSKHCAKMFTAIAAAGLAGALCLGGTATAFAAGQQVDVDSYGYKAAQIAVSDRMATVTVEDADGDTDSSGNAYAEGVDYSYKAGAERGASYADAEHTDAEDLVAAGVIESTDEIDAYAAAKHAEISSRFEGTDGMTAQERHEHFSQFSHDGFAGDTAEELQSEGIIK